MELINRFIAEEQAADATEYALLIGLIALGIVVALGTFAGSLGNAFGNIGTSLGNHVKAS